MQPIDNTVKGTAVTNIILMKRPMRVTVRAKDYRYESELWCAWFDCPHCKHDNPEYQRYCGYCGVRLIYHKDIKELFAPKPKVEGMKPEHGIDGIRGRIDEIKGEHHERQT